MASNSKRIRVDHGNDGEVKSSRSEDGSDNETTSTAAGDASDHGSSNSSSDRRTSTISRADGNLHHGEVDAAGELAGLNPEELEFAMGMMGAMEDGFDTEQEHDDDDDAEEGEAPQERDQNPPQEGGLADLNPEELEYARAMMNAMEDGIQDGNGEEDEENTRDNIAEGDEQGLGLDAEEVEYAMGMMNAMEDGSDEEEAQEEGDQEAREQAFATRHIGGTATNGFAQLGNNILNVCSSLTMAVREYYRMSQNDQLQVWDDLTGYQGQKRVFVQGKELPGYKEEFEPKHIVEASLIQLPLELERMPSSTNHDALDMALAMAPEYVTARPFLLKFLRAEKFDVFAAATRMCRHFESKLEIFPKEALGRDITIDDLDEDDMACLKTGYVQVLQCKDQAHRPVIFYYKAVSSECYKERENLLRAFFYLSSRLSDSEEVQKLGVSNVVYNNGGFPKQGMDYEKSRRLSRQWLGVPIRFNNFYVCLDDNPWLTVVETFAVMITRFLRVRLRMIRGTHEEVVEKLAAVGLPSKALPVNAQSELLLERHLQWIEDQREAEQKAKDLKKLEELGNAGSSAAKPPSELGGNSQMETIASLSELTASFYGRASVDDGDPFRTVG